MQEKRHFDAWGEIAILQDAAERKETARWAVLAKERAGGWRNNLSSFNLLDRGYTGHEHLLGVGLVHMNGRLYDPKLHRFLMPDNYVQDPYNTQNFNRYGYVLNNPFKYTDPSGEIIFGFVIAGAIIGALTAGAAYIAHAIQTGSWNWGHFGMSLLGGAIVGALTAGQLPASISVSYVNSSIAAGFIAGLLPSANFNVGNWSFSVSPSIALGNGIGAGASFSASFSDGHFSFSGGVGVTYYGNYSGLGISGTEFRKSLQASWDDGGKGLTLGTNFWSGSGGLKELNQRTGLLGLHSGDFRATYENDGFPFGLLRDDLTHKALSPRLGDGYDSHRSAALRVSIGEYSLGFNIFTGKRDYRGEVNGAITGPLTDSNGKFFPRGYVNEVGTPHRLGALSFGYKGFNVGINSEKYVSYPIQARFAHGASPQGGFPIISSKTLPYFQYKTPNQFTLW